MFEICQNAVKTAMRTTCGEENSCPNISFSEGNIKAMMSMQICKDNKDKVVGQNELICYPDAYAVDDEDDIIQGLVQATLVGKPDMSYLQIEYNEQDKEYFDFAENKDKDEDLQTLKRMLEQAVGTKVKQLSDDTKVAYCMTGRKIQGISSSETEKNIGAGNNGRYTHLLNGVIEDISNEAMSALWKVVENTAEDVLQTEFAAVNNSINDRLSKIIEINQQKQHQYNEEACKDKEKNGDSDTTLCNYNYTDVIASYDQSTSTCSLETKKYHRDGCGWGFHWDLQETKVIKFTMPISNICGVCNNSYIFI